MCWSKLLRKLWVNWLSETAHKKDMDIQWCADEQKHLLGWPLSHTMRLSALWL